MITTKFTAFEGGMHVPAFVHYPADVEAGSRSDAVATVVDLLPTFLDLAGSRHPGPTYRDRDVLLPQGTSLVPIFFGERGDVRSADHLFGWELYGHRSVRRGDWKLVWDQARPEGERRWALFNLAEDPFEQQDLSTVYPDRHAEMLEAWERYDEDNGVIY